jgi:transposase-like protein
VREQAIVALLSAASIVEAAARVGIGESTLRGWLSDDPAFEAEYEAARRATF